jgi:hypothetical protein
MPASSTAAASDITIDRLLINGLDFKMEDKAVDPPLLVPLKSLDVEVRDISTAALRQDQPIRFNAVVEADKVDLPKLTSKEPTTQQTEPRELFSQITASGSVSLYPKPHGYTKTSINGVELAAFKGEAGAMGVDLDKGIFDGDINTRFNDDRVDLQSKFVLTDLRLTEPKNGPIQTHLGLSAPLDAVLPALQDPDGGITIPLNVPLEKGKLSVGDAVGAAAGAMAQIMMTAVASAPVKAVGGAADLLNMGSKQSATEPATVRIDFRPGDVTLSLAAQQQVDDILRRMKKDDKMQVTLRGEMSSDDASIAYDRANPPPEDCRALAEKFRDQRDELAAQRTTLAARATAELASSSSAASDTLQQLMDLDGQINQADDTMDQLYDMLRPGASNQANRRARAAGLQITDLRIKSVENALLAANLPHAADRIEATRAAEKFAEAGEDGGVVVTIVQRKREK